MTTSWRFKNVTIKNQRRHTLDTRIACHIIPIRVTLGSARLIVLNPLNTYAKHHARRYVDYGFLKKKRRPVVRWWWNHLKNLRRVAQSGRALALGARCRRFESGYADIYRGVEQLVARQAHNLKVAGPSPAPATNKR